MYYYLYISVFCLICILSNTLSDICSTCVCSIKDAGSIINCHNQNYGKNDILIVDLITLNNDQQLNELILSKNDINDLPIHLFEKFKYLRKLDLSQNAIKKIHTEKLTNFSNLENLNIAENSLRIFDDSLLKIFPSLLMLNVSHNKINAIKHTIGEDIKKIKLLNFSHNNISELPTNFFESLLNLQDIDLSFNQIHYFEKNYFLPLHSLKVLRINNNLLTSLNLQILPNSLVELQAGHNLISEISYETSAIRVLNIEYNRISEIKANLTLLHELKHLIIGGNMFSEFPNIVLKKLEILDISNNRLTNISENFTTENFPLLRVLNISQNPIQKLKFYSKLRLRSFIASDINILDSVAEDAFLQLETLPKQCINITISNNIRLSDIHEKALHHLDVCCLDLSNNHLTYIPPKLVKQNTSMETCINLQGNPLNCNCSLQWMLNNLVPKLYSTEPSLLENLRCASPSQISNARIVHWYGWKEQVFCTDVTSENSPIKIASVSDKNVVTFGLSSGVTIVLGITIGLLTLLVITGLLLTQRIYMKRSRMNRRF